MLEIGVQSGGSLVTWNKWFSDANFTYVGVDINPLCTQLDSDENDQVHIEIGSQEDPVFLYNMCEKYGPFDIIIDDGSHWASHMVMTLRTLFPCVVEGGFYVIEDTSVMGSKIYPEFSMFEGKTIAQHIARIYESMHYYWTPFIDQTPHDDVNEVLYDPVFSNAVKSIYMVDSMIVLEKGRDVNQPLRNVMQGTERIPFQSSVTMPVIRVNADGQRVTHDFSAFVAVSSASFTNNEKIRLFAECLTFCIANFEADSTEEVQVACAERLMQHVIRAVFQTTEQISPDLFDVDFSNLIDESAEL
jgi:hypothetical protein